MQEPKKRPLNIMKHHKSIIQAYVYFSVVGLRMGPHIVRNEGPLGLFKGVDASAARQLVYSGVAWLEQVFFFPCSVFFSFWELWTRFCHSNF